MGKNFSNMEDVIPDKGEFQLGEVSTHGEKKGFALFTLLPESQQGLSGGFTYRGIVIFGNPGEGFKRDEGGVGAGVGLASGAAKFTQFRGDGTRKAVFEGQAGEVPGGGLDGEVGFHPEFSQGVEDRGGITEHPDKLIGTGAAIVGGDVSQYLKGTFIRAPFQDTGDNGVEAGIILINADVGEEDKFMEEVGGVVVALEGRAGPTG